MFTEEKIKEIKKKLRNGYPQGELIQELSKYGYSDEEIQNMLFNLSDYKQSDKNQNNHPLWYIASIGFIILGIAILSVKYLWIYYFGYVFLILGIVGLLAKFIINQNLKKDQ